MRNDFKMNYIGHAPRRCASVFNRKMRGICFVGLSCLLWLAVTSSSAYAEGKTGLGASRISLPSGPGSIEGLGSAFEPQLNSGTASYSVSIAAPPGVAGLAPSVAISYNSGGGNSPFGLSWNYEPISIRRQVAKGLPTYSDSDTYVFQGEELVRLSDGSYRVENASGFMRFSRKDSGWEVQAPNGTVYRLGTTAASRVHRPSGTSAYDTYAWYLEEVEDVHGNRIEYHYTSFSDSPGKKYCREIRYSISGLNYHSIIFDYEVRSDVFSSCLSGFEVKTGRRCSQIRVESRGQLVRRYVLEYELPSSDPVEMIAPNDAGLNFSLLRKVTQYDNRTGKSASYLPPLRFGYTRFDAAQRIRGTVSGNPVYSLADPNIALVDINCDALPDLFYTDPYSGEHSVYYNEGDCRFGDPVSFVDYPTGVTLDQPGVQLMDLDGDSRIDLLQKAGGAYDHFVYYASTVPPSGNDESHPAWGREQEMPTPHLPFDLSDPNVRSLDLNGDRRIDYMRTTPDGFIYYYNYPSGWEEDGLYLFGEPQLGDITYADDLLFTDGDGAPNPFVKLADMNGDGLPDLVRMTDFLGNLSFSFWPNLGRGAWGSRIEINSDIDLGAIPASDARVIDINGDGLADVLAVAYDHLEYWINQGDNSFSRQFVVENTPEYIVGQTALRMADINGNGSSDFLWENWDSSVGGYRIDYVDLMGGVKPNLMAVIDNGIGLRTEIEYKTTTDFYLKAKKGGTPWNTRLPFVSTVVAKTTQSFGLDLDAVPGTDSYITENAYYDGYYDTFEKEFRGFAFAKTVQRGDDRYKGTAVETEVNAPSTISRMAFHTGVPDNLDNDHDGKYDEFDPISGYEEECLKGVVLWTETTLLTKDFDGIDNDGDGLVDESDEGQPNGFPADDAVVFSRSSSTWNLKTVHDADGGFTYVDAFNVTKPELSLPFVKTLDGKKVNFAYAGATSTSIFEANGAQAGLDPLIPVRAPKITRTETDVDYYGNTLRTREYGDVTPGSTFDDERFSFMEYGFNLDEWIIGLPTRSLVQDEHGAFVAESKNYYDGDDFQGLSFGHVGSKGLLMRNTANVNGPDPVPGLDQFSKLPGDPRLPANTVITTIRNRYDEYGNLAAVRDAEWSETNEGHETQFFYDPVFHTYMTAEHIIISDTKTIGTAAMYDYGAGVIKLSVDYNGNPTTYQYDSFYRPVSVVRPGDSIAYPSSEYSYRPADPFRKLYYNYAANGDLTLQNVTDGRVIVSQVASRTREESGTGKTFDLYTYSDGAGHALGTIEEGEAPGSWICKGVQRYTSRGSVRSAYLPFTTSQLEFQVPPLDVEHVENFYDGAGRSIRTVNPPETDKDGAKRTEGRMVYLPFETIAYDAEDLDPSSAHYDTPGCGFTDGLGRAVRAEQINRENGVLKTYVTTSDYDLQGNVVRATDAKQNYVTMRYDGLGRKIATNDPDRGASRSSYDRVGNVVQSMDNKQQITYMGYDGANRIETVDYHDSKGLSPDVVYHYDQPSVDYPSFGNLVGQLSFVEDATGAEFNSFDARGRLIHNVKRIIDPVRGQPVDYASSFDFDAMDRVKSRTFPDGDRIEYTYNQRSLLQLIPGLVDNISYIETDQYKTFTYANGVTTTYSYDPRQRLKELHTVGSAGSSGLDLVHYSYTFDGVSNIRAINDLRPTAQIPVGTDRTSRHNTQLLTYDDLYRLTNYTLTDPGYSVNLAQLGYVFDSIGNMAYKSSPVAGQPGHIEHDERGRTLVNMGYMASGGAVGTEGRGPRAPDDAPGPHALTATSDGRQIFYDDNGNMTDLEGMTLAWDFADRLTSVENDAMRADFGYDYSGRRVTKQVTAKDGTATNSLTIYVDKGFEIRNYNVPTKYAFASSRVARFTRMLDTDAERTQWLRINEGWNLIGLYVDPVGETAASLFGLGDWSLSVSQYDAATDTYISLDPGDPILPNVPYMVHASEQRIVTATGTNVQPMIQDIPAGEPLVAWGRSVDPVKLLKDKELNEVWKLADNTTNVQWDIWYADTNAPFSVQIGTMPPEGVNVVKLGTAATLNFELLKTDDIRYYVGDHLGSAGCITDRDGNLIEETVYYPFGSPRHVYAPNGRIADYGYTQKEQDFETGLFYFEARYMVSHLGRFISTDPSGWVDGPNVYAYVRGNPFIYTDPTGLETVFERIRQQGLGTVLSENFSSIGEKFKRPRYRVVNPPNHGPGMGRKVYAYALRAIGAPKVNSLFDERDMDEFGYMDNDSYNNKSERMHNVAWGSGQYVFSLGEATTWPMMFARSTDLSPMMATERRNFLCGSTPMRLDGNRFLYRYHGRYNKLGRNYTYVTDVLYHTEDELRTGAAVLSEWGTTIDSVTVLRPKRNTWMRYGKASSQSGRFSDEFRVGGDYQGLIRSSDIKESEIIRTVPAPWLNE